MSNMADCHTSNILLVTTQHRVQPCSNDMRVWNMGEEQGLGGAAACYRSVKNGLVWTAIYEMKSERKLMELACINHRLCVRGQPMLQQITNVVSRKFCKHISTRGHCNTIAPIITLVSFVVRCEEVEEVNRWYEEQHIEDLSHIPGWRRSRRFEVVHTDAPQVYAELLAIHEFDQINGLGGPEHMRARHRPWRDKIVQLARCRVNQEFELCDEILAEDCMASPESNPSIGAERVSGMVAGCYAGESPSVGTGLRHIVLPEFVHQYVKIMPMRPRPESVCTR